MKHLALLLLLVSSPAFAGGLVAIADVRIAQYKEALGAAREVLHDATIVDPSAGDAADQLKRADAAVILAVGQKALQLARQVSPNVPTVFCMVLGGAAAPGRTVTGVKLEVAPQAQLDLLKQVSPAVKRVGVIYEPRASGPMMEEAVKAAGRLGLTLVSKPVGDAKEVRAALAEIASSIDALWLMPDPRLITAEMFNYLLVFTLEHKIALYGFLDSFTQAGALASVAPDYAEIGKRAARMVADLLGKAPEQRLPVPPPAGSPGALTINLKTARQLGLEISSGVQSKARQVFK
jgi:putative tryptophan/tyrosine transport system substrate-binding protein